LLVTLVGVCAISGALTVHFGLARHRLELELMLKGDEGRRA
jgi:hypothetical protein